MSAAEVPRADCPHCGHNSALRRDGTVWTHLRRSRYGRHITVHTCPGSGKAPYDRGEMGAGL